MVMDGDDWQGLQTTNFDKFRLRCAKRDVTTSILNWIRIHTVAYTNKFSPYSELNGGYSHIFFYNTN